MIELSQSGQNLYVLYCLFLNSLMLDSCIESRIIYFTHPDHILLFRWVLNLGKRSLNMIAFATGGGIVGAGATTYSPLVDIPGVNDFQIKYGRGYGYRTGLDWTSGYICHRYLSDAQMRALIEKHGAEDKILDGIFFRLMLEEKDIRQIIKKNATINELRYLGLKHF